MPDFNFADDSGKEKKSGKENSSPIFFPPQEDASGIASGSASPAKSPAVTRPVPPLPKPAATVSPASGSTTPPVPPAAAEAPSVPAASESPVTAASGEPDRSDPAQHAGGAALPPFDEFVEVEHDPVRPPSRRWPLIGFGSLVLVLVTVAFVWFYNPFPGLKKSIELLFGSRTVAVHVPRSKMHRRDTARMEAATESGPEHALPEQEAPSSAPRDWDYFVQIASCPRNPEAQVIANQLKRGGIPATTEPEYIKAKRQAYYRVKAGPFPNFLLASRVKDSLRRTWRDAFVDSARYEPYLHEHQTPQVLQPELGGKAPPRTPVPTAAAPGPARGYGIRVAAYQSKASAQSEMAAMLKKGYPAFITSKSTPTGLWFRVYVGPFGTRGDAEKYTSAIRARVNSGAYVVDFSSESKK